MVLKEEPRRFEEDQVVDEENLMYGQEAGLNIRTLIMTHMSRTSSFIFKSDPSPTTKGEVVVRDTRPVVIQAIQFLVALIQPHYDEKMEKKQKELMEAIPKLKNSLILSSIENEAYRRSIQATNSNRSKVYKEFVEYFIKNKIHTYDKNSSEYEIYIQNSYEIYLKIFEEINYLLHRKDYLKSEAYVE